MVGEIVHALKAEQFFCDGDEGLLFVLAADVTCDECYVIFGPNQAKNAKNGIPEQQPIKIPRCRKDKFACFLRVNYLSQTVWNFQSLILDVEGNEPNHFFVLSSENDFGMGG